MIARLQRWIVCALGVAALVWTVLSLNSAHAAWTWAGLVLLGFGHAFVLAIEFGWMHAVNAGDPAPRATLRQVLVAWLGECRHAPLVFGWRQPFRAQAWPDVTPGTPGRRGVVLVHGFVCNRGIWNRWLARLQAQGTPVIAITMEPPFGRIEGYAPAIEAAVAALERSSGMAPVVVAHSMGGLALRYWWNRAGNGDRIHHAITLGTPHHGTRLAALALSANGRQMREHGPWLAALGQAEPPDRGAHMSCFYSHCDNIVFPARSATLPGAENRHLPATAHVAMVDHPEPWSELQRRLRT